MSSLNKGNPEVDGNVVWYTDNFVVQVGDDEMGYVLRNKDTFSIELMVEQETQAVIAIQQLQQSYEEIMKDPVAKFEELENERRVSRSQQSLKLQ